MKSFSQFVEEVAANNVGSGNVKGIAPGEDPPVWPKKRKKVSSSLLKRMINKMTVPQKSNISIKV